MTPASTPQPDTSLDTSTSSPSFDPPDGYGHNPDDSQPSPRQVPLPTSTSSLTLSPRAAPPYPLSFQNASSSSLQALEHEYFPPILEGKTTGNGFEAEDGDLSAPFESIPLSSTPPRESPTVPTVPLPSSPRGTLSPRSVKKRRSWGGFGVSSDGHQTARGELPEHPPPQPSQSAEDLPAVHDTHGRKGASRRLSTSTPGPSTSRRAAPPPHPFPWPIPTSPRSSSSKRLSIISNTSNGTHATHASQGSASAASSQPPIQGQGHQHAGPALGVKGVSTFEKVISHTRPSWLPPKDRIEDVIHLHQWEDMMRHAREHEKVLAKEAEVRRLEKEKRLAVEAPKWEKLLSDEKEFSVKKVKENKEWRKLWFEGVPSHLRGKAWSMAVGNPLALSKGMLLSQPKLFFIFFVAHPLVCIDIYKTYLARARKGLATGRFPVDLLKTIEGDMDNTLVTLKVFTRGSPLRDDLRELICAWLVFRSDERLGYVSFLLL